MSIFSEALRDLVTGTEVNAHFKRLRDQSAYDHVRKRLRLKNFAKHGLGVTGWDCQTIKMKT